MISPPAFAPLTNSCQLDVMHASTSDTGAQLDIRGLENACALLGGTHAWVTRYSSSGCQLVSLLGLAMEIDSSLNALLEHSAQNFHESPVTLLRWRDQTLMCASLSGRQEDDCTYMLCLLFDGRFEMTSRLAGLLEELRCSMREQIRRQLATQWPEPARPPQRQTVSCTCCNRIYSFEKGWIPRGHESIPRDEGNNSRTVCERCALALYSNTLQAQT